mgnify:CR=1 FL=1
MNSPAPATVPAGAAADQAGEVRAALDARDRFVDRHLGSSEQDVLAMLETVGADSLEALIHQTIPSSIRLGGPLNLPEALGEHAALDRLRQIEIGRAHV